MFIAIYARVSTERRAEQGASIDDQVAKMTKWAEKEGHVVIQTFVEAGASAFEGAAPSIPGDAQAAI
jgi:site-specific DNA recombinase